MMRARKCLFYKYNFRLRPVGVFCIPRLAFVPLEHYENFPVASWLLPGHLRGPIQTIYAFARSADDFADEGSLSNTERIALLDGYEAQLDLIEANAPLTAPLFVELAHVITVHRLPVPLFRDLLSAFRQDVTRTRYATFDQLMDYCHRSADPIGRLLLHLNARTAPQYLVWSDAVCSALQLANHWQDVAIDWRKNDGGRVYLPQEDLARFGLSEHDIANQSRSSAWREMMAFQCSRARQLMVSGACLGHALPGRMGAELRLIIAGGMAILDRIDAVDGDVFHRRPTLSKWDWIKIGPGALVSRRLPIAISAPTPS
jgi:squalene synthase HpnC